MFPAGSIRSSRGRAGLERIRSRVRLAGINGPLTRAAVRKVPNPDPRLEDTSDTALFRAVRDPFGRNRQSARGGFRRPPKKSAAIPNPIDAMPPSK
jgi:hypothetical protein